MEWLAGWFNQSTTIDPRLRRILCPTDYVARYPSMANFHGSRRGFNTCQYTLYTSMYTHQAPISAQGKNKKLNQIWAQPNHKKITTITHACVGNLLIDTRGNGRSSEDLHRGRYWASIDLRSWSVMKSITRRWNDTNVKWSIRRAYITVG